MFNLKRLVFALVVVLVVSAGVACTQELDLSEPISSNDIEVKGFNETFEELIADNDLEANPFFDSESYAEFIRTFAVGLLTNVREMAVAIPESEWSEEILNAAVGGFDPFGGLDNLPTDGASENGEQTTSEITICVRGQELDEAMIEELVFNRKGNFLALFDAYIREAEQIGN